MGRYSWTYLVKFGSILSVAGIAGGTAAAGAAATSLGPLAILGYWGLRYFVKNWTGNPMKGWHVSKNDDLIVNVTMGEVSPNSIRPSYLSTTASPTRNGLSTARPRIASAIARSE
jgi:hypothetical protein